MSYASFDDVQVRFFRDLTEEEKPLVEARLEDAESKIRTRIKDLDSRVIADPGFLDTVIRVCSDAVIRLVRNPEGYIQETEGNYTYMLSSSSADGRLVITQDEWEDLGVRRKVGVFHVIPELPESLRAGL